MILGGVKAAMLTFVLDSSEVAINFIPYNINLTISMNCIHCGSTLTYTPGAIALQCISCHGETPWSSAPPPQPADLCTQLAQDAQLPLMESYNCQSCGAHIESPTESVIHCCPFCRNNLGPKRQMCKHFVPEYILPFHIAKESLFQRLTEWNRHRTDIIQTVDGIPTLADTQFLNIQAEPVYLPYWLFIRSSAEAQICTIPLTLTKRVSASIPAMLPHYSGAQFPRQETYVLEPWPTLDFLPFNTAFIRNIAVESPQWNVKEVWSHFQDSVAFMELYLQEYGVNTDIQQTAVEFTLQSLLHPKQTHSFNIARWRDFVVAQDFQIAQALLPVWICHLPGNNPQRVFVNGASG